MFKFFYKFSCSVCNSKVKKFNPLPDYYKHQYDRYNFKEVLTCEMTDLNSYSCPVCGASDRERLLAYYIKKKIKGESRFKVAHFAPEGQLLNLLRNSLALDVVTIDLMMEDVDYNLDITNLRPINENTYDIILCSHVLEHIKDDVSAIKELYRIIKPGGWGIIMVPICLSIEETREEEPGRHYSVEERWKLFGQDDHVRLYSKKGFKDVLTSSGFYLEEFSSLDLGIDVFKRLGLKETSVLYVVNKV